MSAFYVGQRVKKARGNHAVGMEGVVTAIDPSQAPEWMMRVRTDAPIMRVNCEDMTPAGLGREGWTNPDLWEPIIPLGLESLDRINELYEPEPELSGYERPLDSPRASHE